MNNIGKYLSAFTLSLILVSCGPSGTGQGAQTNSTAASSVISVRLKEVVTNLNSPIAFADPADGSGRFFIAEQGGLIRIMKDGKLLERPFLSLKDKMVSLNAFYDERGLLGFVFHPDFRSNRKFYVYYSAPSKAKGSNHKSVIAEYTVSADPDVANAVGKVIMEIEEPEANHNGGQLAFAKDGYLYIAVGDGGGAGDKHGAEGNGQNLQTLLGKILRIDINVGAYPYKIPSDNPFVNEDAKSEIWAYGLRNPWRFSFDRQTGKLFCADVGQDEYEEVNIIEKGKNYGWRIMEATHCFNPQVNCNKEGLTLPINEYSHEVGKSITGGFVYRGNIITELTGKYIFADWTGPLFYLTETGKDQWSRSDLQVINKPEDLRVLSFGEDEKGELYILTSREVTPKSFTGSVYKIIPR